MLSSAFGCFGAGLCAGEETFVFHGVCSIEVDAVRVLLALMGLEAMRRCYAASINP